MGLLVVYLFTFIPLCANRLLLCCSKLNLTPSSTTGSSTLTPSYPSSTTLLSLSVLVLSPKINLLGTTTAVVFWGVNFSGLEPSS
jgi:hypothetical protein